MNSSQFAEVAKQAIRRITLAKWFDVLARSAQIVFPVLVVVAFVGWLLDYPVLQLDLTQTCVVSFVWFVGTALWARQKRPDAVSALAL